MKKVLSQVLLFLLLFLCRCEPAATPKPLPTLPLATLAENCDTPGTIISADLPKPTRGSSYRYLVYIPPCYSAESESGYPVLYLVPGRSSSPDSWFAAGVPEVVDQLILRKEIPPFIIVATQNIDADPMADTIYKELIPHIESQYSIIDNRRYRAVAGGSLGGIAAYRLGFQHPDTFSSAGIFGAGAISGEETRINQWLASMSDQNRVRVFMDTGDEDPLMLERAEVMKSILDQAGIENILYTGHGGHNYTYWVSNFEMYLNWLAEDW